MECFFLLFLSACFSVSPSFGFLSLLDIYFIITFHIVVVVFVYILLHSHGDTNVFLSLAQLCACVCHGCATFTTELKCLNSSLIAEFELK